MASFQLDARTKRGNYSVGNVASWNHETFANGAEVKEVGGIENYRLAKVVYENGVAKAAYPTNKADVCFLVTTPEQRLAGEPLCNFYNAQGDMATLAVLAENFMFATSAFEKDATVTTVELGNKAHFDVTKKTFVIHKGAHADYAGSAHKFEVIDFEDETMYTIDGKELVTLRVIR